jgi:hypothetical protein
MKNCRRALIFVVSILAGCTRGRGNIKHEELMRIIGGLEAVKDHYFYAVLMIGLDGAIVVDR